MAQKGGRVTSVREWDGAAGDLVPDVDSVLGDYRLLQTLGEGASSRVFAAEHVPSGRRVALKILLETHDASITRVMRFLLEMQLIARIQHDHVVRLVDVVNIHARHKHAVLELLEGETLRSRLTREGVLAPREVVRIGGQLASALASVHAAGVIHCDVKPENVFLAAQPSGPTSVKLFDFDAARWIDLSTARPTAIVPSGAILGTPDYMAPEQEQGDDVDYRADVYAFGVTLFEMITGETPYSAATFGDRVLARIFNAPKAPRSFRDLPYEIPESLNALVLRCVERSRDRRPATMNDVSLELLAIAAELDRTDPTAPLDIAAA